MDKLKKGQKVWAYRHSRYFPVCEQMIVHGECVLSTDDVLLQGENGNTILSKDQIFATKKECVDYIIKNIKVLRL